MRVIPPVPITPAMVTSSTAVEPLAPANYAAGTTYANGTLILNPVDGFIYQSIQDSNINNTPAISPLYWQQLGYAEPAYNAGTTYALNATVSYNHQIWQSLAAGNIGNQPDISPNSWASVGYTNKWRCFDLVRNTMTVGTSPMTIVLQPGIRFDSIALLGVGADAVRIQVSIAGQTLYDQTTSLIARFVSNWYDHFYQSFVILPSVIAFNLPPSSIAILTVTLTRAAGNCELGSLVIGSNVYLGAAQYDAVSDVLNFSTIDRDAWGNSILVPRRNVPKTQSTVWSNASDIDKIRALRVALNAAPAVWAGLDDDTQPYFESLLILGIYKQFSIDLAYPEKAVLTLELEEV